MPADDGSRLGLQDRAGVEPPRLESGDEPDRDGRRETHRGRKREHARVEVRRKMHLCREEVDERSTAEPSEEKPAEHAESRKDQSLREELRQDPAAAGADRQPYRELLPPGE